MNEVIARTSPRKWLRLLARWGYAARGMVYLLIGGLALLAAFGSAEETGSRGALRTLMAGNFGPLLLFAIAVGLAAHACWRMAQAILDADDMGLGWRGLAVRAALLASALSYGALALYALGLAGIAGGGSGSGGQDHAISLLVAVTGSWGGTIILSSLFAAIALAHVWKAATAGYARHVHPPDRYETAVHLVSIGGLIARGTVFATIAFLLWARRLDYGSGSVPDTETVLSWLESLPMGSVILGGLGVGLILFCLYSFAEAAWREVSLPRA